MVSTVAYTAFGDPVTPDGQGGWRVGIPADLGTRYQYDGGWGYESGLITLWGEDTTLPPVTLQHVGWRWYQPSIGRFIQRDPIGLGGGLNVYEYVRSSAVMRVAPSGKGPRWDAFLAWVKETFFAVTVPPVITATEAAPDIARICIAAGHRGELVDALSGNTADDNAAWEEYEQGPPPPPPPPIDIDPSILW